MTKAQQQKVYPEPEYPEERKIKRTRFHWKIRLTYGLHTSSYNKGRDQEWPLEGHFHLIR